MKKEKKPSPLIRLLAYTGNYKGLLFSGLFLFAIAMVLGMAPYICMVFQDELLRQNGEFAKMVRLQQQSDDWTVN